MLFYSSGRATPKYLNDPEVLLPPMGIRPSIMMAYPTFLTIKDQRERLGRLIAMRYYCSGHGRKTDFPGTTGKAY